MKYLLTTALVLALLGCSDPKREALEREEERLVSENDGQAKVLAVHADNYGYVAVLEGRNDGRRLTTFNSWWNDTNVPVPGDLVRFERKGRGHRTGFHYALVEVVQRRDH